ncbi:MAG: ATP-binding protein [Deltaproteobacteria bacterium]|jgi:MinD superfamily P-loop ATPase|nr:ATP-binding protein [Deltaproteobacteria bacterium]
MIISIASGKGGTGKTTVATNLAQSVGIDVQLLDCDVEEPNAHLFMKPSFEGSQTVFLPVPEVDEDRCTYCGKCAQICQFKAIAVVAQNILIFEELCHSCGGCWEVCPEDAIRRGRRELGIIERGLSNGIEFIHGRLRVGEAMSPPLIKKVRAYQDSNKLTIIDAPPGTSCPVIAAMKKSDFVLLVTEPTPFGLYDLKLAVGAVQILDIPMGLVINRSDLGDDRVREYAHREKFPILLEIPFDRQIAEAYSRGEMLVDVMPQWKDRFLALYDSIRHLSRNQTLNTKHQS